MMLREVIRAPIGKTPNITVCRPFLHEADKRLVFVVVKDVVAIYAGK